jgi:hypothetical protein
MVIAKVEGGKTYGELLLTPTIIYAKLIGIYSKTL